MDIIDKYNKKSPKIEATFCRDKNKNSKSHKR